MAKNRSFQEYIIRWLTPQLCCIKTKGLGVWLIGSIASGKANPNDCDLLVIAPLSELVSINEYTDLLRKHFRSEFELPLHLTIISTEELEDCKEFLSKVFQRKTIEI